ncbi:MAG: NUDIX hydrolase [Gammaproteobacteria bacterium]
MKSPIIAFLAACVFACSVTSNSGTASESRSTERVSMLKSLDVLDGAWTETQVSELLDKTTELRFNYAADQLSANERAAVVELLKAGERLHSLYIDQVHPQARLAEAALNKVEGRSDLKDLFRIMKGPVTTTLDNQRVTFLNVVPAAPARNVYPAGLTREKMDRFLEENPERRDDILHVRSVVREATSSMRQAALATLDERPTLDVLHPGLRKHISTATDYFTLPYSVAYADDIFFVYDRLNDAANLLEKEDAAFTRYLRLRARDLLADDYDGGDATWVTGQFTGNLNAQIGSYETYDDALYGVKSFFSLSLLQRDKAKSAELAASIGDIQSIENGLPYSAHKTVRSNIPVAVYNVIADFGQARGTNTATILPNEGHLSRQFGRTILIRSNVLTNTEIFASSKTSFDAATHPQHHSDLDINGNFYRTLWHEIGHYLGPDETATGGDIDAALQDTADLFEEMKSDLVSLYSAKKLYERNAYKDEEFRSIYAGGILRVVQKNKPRREQAYGTMKLIQFNWFLDKGLLAFEDGRLVINYDRYAETVSSLLKEVLNIQYVGNRDAATAFVDTWTNWEENIHGVIAKAMKDAETSRFRLVRYEALGE